MCYFVLQEKAQCFQKALASQADKSTQTELIGHDVSSCVEQYFLSSLWVFRLLSACLPLLLLCPCVDLVGFTGTPFIRCSSMILKYALKHEKTITMTCQHTECPINFMLYKELRISISECGRYVLVDCNYFSVFVYTLIENLMRLLCL